MGIEIAYSHSGGLNSKGCHAGSKPYHCHRRQSEMVGNRLRCDLGSRSNDCDTQKTPQIPNSKDDYIKEVPNGFIRYNYLYCYNGYIKNIVTSTCEKIAK